MCLVIFRVSHLFFFFFFFFQAEDGIRDTSVTGVQTCALPIWLSSRDQYPVAARSGSGNTRGVPDRLTAKLAALHFYQLSIPAPKALAGSFSAAAASRGKALFNGKARCASCHVPPLFTEPGNNLHAPAEIGVDAFQADRSPTHMYRTAPLAGLWAHQKGGFYHDGRFATLLDVVAHYDTFFKLSLSDQEKQDLIEYLKGL